MSTLEGCVSIEITNFQIAFTLGGCDGLERTVCLQFWLWERMVVLNELIFNSFQFWGLCCFEGIKFWIISPLGGYGHLVRTDFGQFILQRVWLSWVIFNSFHFGRMWWNGKDWFCHFSLWKDMEALRGLVLNSFHFGVCCSWKNVFWHFPLEDNVVVLKWLIFTCFCFGRMQQSWKHWFWVICTLGWSLEGTI